MVEGRRATAEQAAADHARYAKLSDAAVSQQKVEAAKAADLSAQAAYEQAVADRDLAKLNLDRSRCAPRSAAGSPIWSCVRAPTSPPAGA